VAALAIPASKNRHVRERKAAIQAKVDALKS